MKHLIARTAWLLAGTATCLSATPALAAKAPPGSFAAGPDLNGDQCTATRSWSNGRALFKERDQPFAITCRGSTQQRAWIDVATEKPPLAPERCGPAQQLSLPGIGPATLRRCRDARIFGEAVVIETPTLRASAMPGALSPAVTAMHRLSGAAAADKPLSVDPDLLGKLAPAPALAGADAAAPAVASPTGLDLVSAISQGLQAIYSGRNVEASRLLNDALALFADAPPLQRAELQLDAGLADSNIGEFRSADGHFAAATRLLAQTPPSPARTRLVAQAAGYRALHLSNQGEWQGVLDALSTTNAGASPLTDSATLARLNAGGGSDIGVGLDTDQINELLLIAQREIARSTAYIRLGRPDEANRALRLAYTQGLQPAEAILGNDASRGRLNWLRARLERQEGRVRLARGDRAGALASFDCALAVMYATPQPEGRRCFLPDAPGARGTALTGPAIADVRLERTAILAQDGATSRADVIAAYEQAVATLTSSSEGGFVASPRLAPYLRMLADDAARGDVTASERFFTALQTVREPGIARDIAAIDAELSSGTAGALVRERRDLERRRAQLRYEIPGLAAGSRELSDAQAESATVERRLDEVNIALAKDGKRPGLDEPAVTTTQLRAALRPGEAYLKLAPVGTRLFGAVVTPADVTVYEVESPDLPVATLADRVLRSARAQTDAQGRVSVRPFASGLSYELFRRVAGPAADRLRAATAVIVDSGAALRGLPAAVLVTEPVATARQASVDYGAIPFLVRKAAITSALSPSAFIRVRTSLSPSRAPGKLIGFGANALPEPPSTPAVAETPVVVSAACSIPYAQWAQAMRYNAPIPVDEIRAGARALGVPDAPIITGEAFTNAELLRESEQGKLAGYQVLHFATHGLPATPLPGICETPLPPALLTTVEAPKPGLPTRSNGLLSFIDVARLELDANLVILSACDTAASVSTDAGRLAGQEESAGTLDGLVRAFVAAKARAVIATYWSVSARRGTEELIKGFYEAGRSRTMGEALREAQLRVLAQPGTSHPYFWGAFFFVGDGMRPMLSTGAALASR